MIARAGPEICRRGGRMLGPWALRDSGGLAITRDGGDLIVRTVAAERGDWPWTRRRTAEKTYKLKNIR